jgi:hypothetical protein
MIDRFMVLAERYCQQGKVRKEDYDNLRVQSENMKATLRAVDERGLIATEMAERARQRAMRHRRR